MPDLTVTNSERADGRRQPTALNPRTVRVAVVLPVRNEAKHIATTLGCVAAQTFPSDRIEIIAVDGGSTDGTRAILDEWANRHPNLRVLSNSRGTTPTSLNLGIAAADADVIVRVDGHCRIESDYVERCVELLAASGAANVGGPMRSRGDGPVGEAIATATSSRVGIGNARFHYLEREEWVDTVYLGAFRRDVLEEVGGYDALLVRNQDDELNYRIRQAGYGILLSPRIRSTYTPRTSLRALWRQYYQYGWWKVRVIEKHPGSMQPRHLAPLALVSVLAGSLLTFAITRRRAVLTVPALYLAAITSTGMAKAKGSPSRGFLLALVYACLHLSYGTGFLVGLISKGPGRRRW